MSAEQAGLFGLVELAPEDPGQRWRTPRRLGAALVDEAGIDLDIAADSTNHLCRDFWTRRDDAASNSWPANRRIWCNPPFRFAKVFADQALDHASRGGFSRFLVIDRGAQWLEQAMMRAKWWRFVGRVQYEPAPENADKGGQVTFGSVLLEFGGGVGFAGWRCPETGEVLS